MSKEIQEAHLKLLPPEVFSLITDYEIVNHNNTNTIIGKLPSGHCILPAGKNRKTWTWNFNMRTTYYPDYKTYLNLVAI